jgi:hypothetical protein
MSECADDLGCAFRRAHVLVVNIKYRSPMRRKSSRREQFRQRPKDWARFERPAEATGEATCLYLYLHRLRLRRGASSRLGSPTPSRRRFGACRCTSDFGRMAGVSRHGATASRSWVFGEATVVGCRAPIFGIWRGPPTGADFGSHRTNRTSCGTADACSTAMDPDDRPRFWPLRCFPGSGFRRFRP